MPASAVYQQFTGKPGFWGGCQEPEICIIAFASFHGVNAPTMVDFKLPMV